VKPGKSGGPTALQGELARALQQHQQGQLAQAEQGYRRILRSAPQQFDALQLMGVLAGQTQRFDEALDWLQRALKQRPDSAPALNNLGNTLANLGRHAEALQAFDRALALRPTDHKALRNRGTALRALGRREDALASFDAALALAPNYAEALVSRAEALVSLQRHDEAVAAFERALPLGKDTELIRYALASLGAQATPPAAPPDYVAALFDGYADNFDAHLQGKLAYRTPELLAQALMAQQPPVHSHIVDLGCGTGLCGPHLKPLARRLVGVDLSAAMLDKARATGLYDELIQGDLAPVLRAQPASLDIAVAADVFVYIGDLAEVFAAVQARLQPGGLFAFSVEACDDETTDYRLSPTRRYAHSLPYLQRLAAAQGFNMLSSQCQAIRQQADQAVQGWLVVLRRQVA